MAKVSHRPRLQIGKLGLVWGLLLLVAFFSIVKTSSFATTANVGSILSGSAVLSLIALGTMVPLIVGQFDLSPGYVASLSVMLTAGLISRHDVAWPVALLVVLLVGAGIGALMGVLIGYVGLNSLIVSLGTGTVVSGIVLWYSKGEIIFEGIPLSLLDIGQTRIGFVPLPFLYAIGIALVIWYVLSYRPVGRRLYAVGGNPEAARLVGVPVARYVMVSFVTSSTLAALAGFVQVARLGAGHPTSAQSYLLPAFAAAFLGATSFRPGLYNVWGTFVAVYLLAVGTTGLFMLGAQSYVEPVFNGLVLLVAVLVALVSSRRKRQRLERQSAAEALEQHPVASLDPSEPLAPAGR